MSRFVVGVDGGGTRTEAVVLGAGGQLLGRAVGRAALLESANADAVAMAIRQVSEQAASEAGLTLPAAAVHAGVAGAGRRHVREALEAALADASVADQVRVGTDVAVAARDALGGGPGIVLLAGTGSIGWGRAPDGREERVGGWGSLLGDDGSGYAIGLQSMRAAARAQDGRGPGTALVGRLLAELSLDRTEALIAWAQRATKAEVAALAPLVLELSGTDPVARNIVDQAAADLGAHARVLADRLGPGSPDELVVHPAGGLLTGGTILRERVAAHLSSQGLVISEREVDGARGAGLLALEMLPG